MSPLKDKIVQHAAMTDENARDADISADTFEVQTKKASPSHSAFSPFPHSASCHEPSKDKKKSGEIST